KKIAQSTIVMTPTSEPYVPGALGKWPTPKAVAMAYANRGFWPLCAAGAASALVVIVIRWLRQFVQFPVIFIENGLGDDIFFRRPVAQVLQSASFAAKRKFSMNGGIGRRFADWAAMLHVSGDSFICGPYRA